MSERVVAGNYEASITYGLPEWAPKGMQYIRGSCLQCSWAIRGYDKGDIVKAIGYHLKAHLNAPTTYQPEEYF